MEVKEVVLEGYNGRYTVASDGVVHSNWTGEKVAFNSQPVGKGRYKYKTVCLRRDDGKQVTHYIHRLVAIAFIPNPENKYTVNHIDGDKLNNHVDNLEWATLSENASHAWAIGLCDDILLTQEDLDARTLELIYTKLPRGKYRYYRSMVSWAVLREEGLPSKILSVQNPDTVPLMELWKHIKMMCEDFVSGMATKDLRLKYDLTVSGVSRIRAKNRRNDAWECYEHWLLNEA